MKVLSEFFVMLWFVTKTAMAQGSIGDRVWQDINRNGIQEAGEPGIPGVSVALLVGENTLLLTTTTDANGNYLFTNLSAGVYQVKFTLPVDFVFSMPNQGGNDAVDSDADPITGTTAMIALSAGQSDFIWDAGMYRPDEPPASSPMPSLQPSSQPTTNPACPCENDWKNKNKYVNCVKKDVKERVRLGLITQQQADDILDAAIANDCGK